MSDPSRIAMQHAMSVASSHYASIASEAAIPRMRHADSDIALTAGTSISSTAHTAGSRPRLTDHTKTPEEELKWYTAEWQEHLPLVVPKAKMVEHKATALEERQAAAVARTLSLAALKVTQRKEPPEAATAITPPQAAAVPHLNSSLPSRRNWNLCSSY